MRVLICGGGVIGASIAYFLSCRGVKATVIEGTGLACAASGKPGGFLALDPLVSAGARDRLARAEEPVVRRLSGGGNEIRTLGPPSEGLRCFRNSPVQFGNSPS